MAISSQDVIIDQQPILTDGSATTQPVSGTVTATQTTGTNLHVVTDATSTTVATQATGTNLHVVTDATSTTVATQTTGTNLHTVTDSGSTTAVTGNVTVVQPTGTNLHTVVDSGTISATQGTSPWVISGTVTVGTGTTATITQVAVTNAASVTLLAANASRKKAIFTMPTIGTALYIGYTTTTNSTTTFTWKLVANNSSLEELNYTGVISAISTGATNTVTITEIV